MSRAIQPHTQSPEPLYLSRRCPESGVWNPMSDVSVARDADSLVLHVVGEGGETAAEIRL